MQAKQLAFFVVAFSIAITAINASGIFDYNLNGYEVDVDDDLTKGITEIDNSVASSGDLADLTDGWKMLSNIWSTVTTIFSVLVLPYPWFVGMGVNEGISAGIQTMVTLVESWGFIQFVSNRSDKGMG